MKVRDMANRLREWATEIEDVGPPVEIAPGITLTEAARVLREATGNEYLTIKLDVTVHNDGTTRVDWGTYVHGYDHNNGHATLQGAVEARLNLLREPDNDQVAAADAALIPTKLTEAEQIQAIGLAGFVRDDEPNPCH